MLNSTLRQVVFGGINPVTLIRYCQCFPDFSLKVEWYGMVVYQFRQQFLTSPCATTVSQSAENFLLFHSAQGHRLWPTVSLKITTAVSLKQKAMHAKHLTYYVKLIKAYPRGKILLFAGGKNYFKHCIQIQQPAQSWW